LRFVQAAKLQDVIDHLLSMGYVDFLRAFGNSLKPISQLSYDLDMSLCDFVFILLQPFFWVLVSFFRLGRTYLSLQNLGSFRMRVVKSYMHPTEGTAPGRNPDMMA